MGTLSANVISDTYKNLIFTKETNNKLYYTNGSDVDTEITTLASPMTLSGLITASLGIKLGNNIIYNSDTEACLTLDADQGVSLTAAKVLYVDSIAEKTSANGVSIDSVLLKDGNVKLGASNTIQDSGGGNAIVLDTSSNVTVLGDLTVKGDDIVIGDADDAADKTINFRHDSCEVFMGIDDSQESNTGAFVIHTGTGFQTAKLDNDFVLDSSGNLHLGNGELRTTKIAYTDGDDALTIGDSGVLTTASSLTLGGNLVIPNNGNIGSSDDTDAISISSAGVVTFSQNIIQSGSSVNTFASKVLLNGNSGPTAGAGITDASGETYLSWVERCGNMIKTSIYIDIAGLQANGDQKVIGNDGDTHCHLGQITTVLNGSIVGGKITCLEEPATGDRDIDLCFDDADDGAEAGDLTSETDLVVRGGDWTTSEMRTFGTVVTANNYLYLRTGTNASDNTYSAGKFIIELWGTA